MFQINYQRIRYFLKAAECGSFSGAATQMYISAQALTKQIDQFEAELGGKLFVRSPQGAKLTRFGAYAYQKLQKIDEELEAVCADLAERASGEKESIRIGIFKALPQETIVSPVLSFLLGAHSGYQFQLELVELHEGRSMMREGKLDLLITNTHEEDDWGENQLLSFAEYEVQVVVSLLHPWAIKDTITVDDMKKDTFIKMDMDMSNYKVSPEVSFYENIPCRDITRAKNFDTTFALLQQGKGFAVFPRAYAYMDSARMKYFDYPGKSLKFYTALIYNPKSPLSQILEIVTDVEEEFDLTRIQP